MKLIKETEPSIDNRGYRQRMGIFLCGGCGKEFEKIFAAKRYKSCGCRRGLNIVTHGLTNTKLYHTWEGMVQRCTNKRSDNFKYYGGVGIKVCDDWKNSFESFLRWALNNNFEEHLQIDRIDPDNGYSPQNCQFTTVTENIRRRRSTKLSTEKAEEIRRLYSEGGYTQRKLSKMFGIAVSGINLIINNKTWK